MDIEKLDKAKNLANEIEKGKQRISDINQIADYGKSIYVTDYSNRSVLIPDEAKSLYLQILKAHYQGEQDKLEKDFAAL